MKEACVHCGNNPVSHFSAWISNSFSAPANRLYLAVCGKSEQKVLGRLTNRLIDIWIAIFARLGILQIHRDVRKAGSARGRVLWEEAIRRGIEMHSFLFLGQTTDVYKAHVAGRRIYFSALPRPAYTRSGSDWWLDDKAILKEKLSRAGIPVPRGGSFSDFEDCARQFEILRKPVVLKPQIGSRGRHTTTHIYTQEQLEKAFNIAKQISYWVVMEEHLIGSIYRATVVDGMLAAVLRGDPPRVVGDGKCTVAELVERKNAQRHEKVSRVILDGRHREFLARTGRDFRTIPERGERVDLLSYIGVSYGGNSAEVTAETHNETKRIMEQAAAIIDDPIIGFDFIIGDIQKPPSSQRWGIIECNSTPFINLHHDPVEGAPINVAKAVWDYVERNIERY